MANCRYENNRSDDWLEYNCDCQVCRSCEKCECNCCNTSTIDYCCSPQIIDECSSRCQCTVNPNNSCHGLQGPLGPRGPKGPKGDTGIRGDMGPQGDPGCQGPRGPKGNSGPEGPPGCQGPRGPRGDIGPIGCQGPAGPEGPKGDMGPQGPCGPQGPEGIAGPMGPEGPQGLRGCQGPEGPQGERGYPGPTGPEGPPGETCNGSHADMYNYNISSIGKSEQFKVDFIVFNLSYNTSESLSMNIFTHMPSIIIDFVCFNNWNNKEICSENNYELTLNSLELSIDISSVSHTISTIIIRQQNPDTLQWSLHKIQLFSSENGCRTTVWIEKVY